MSLKNLMHSVIGSSLTSNQMSAAIQQGILTAPSATYRNNKKLFHGMVEVLQVANGYIVNIGRKEGYEFETHIASTIIEVNEIIAAQIVAFKLEDKS